jgi:hypothetical protein
VRGRSIARSATLAAAAFAGHAACGLDPRYDDTHFRCPPESPTCPEGFTCVAERCEAIAGTDAALADAGTDGAPDGPPDVCALAAAAPDNDHCAAAIDLTAAATMPAGATVYGDTTGYASDLNPAIIATCTGAPTPGADAIYKIDAAATDQLVLELALVDSDGALYLLDGCSTGAACLGGEDDTAVGNIEMRTFSIPATDTYYIVVDSRLTTPSGDGCFTLRARLD